MLLSFSIIKKKYVQHAAVPNSGLGNDRSSASKLFPHWRKPGWVGRGRVHPWPRLSPDNTQTADTPVIQNTSGLGAAVWTQLNVYSYTFHRTTHQSCTTTYRTQSKTQWLHRYSMRPQKCMRSIISTPWTRRHKPPRHGHTLEPRPFQVSVVSSILKVSRLICGSNKVNSSTKNLPSSSFQSPQRTENWPCLSPQWKLLDTRLQHPIVSTHKWIQGQITSVSFSGPMNAEPVIKSNYSHSAPTLSVTLSTPDGRKQPNIDLLPVQAFIKLRLFPLGWYYPSLEKLMSSKRFLFRIFN